MHRPDEEACMSDMGPEQPVDDSVEQDQDAIPNAAELEESDLARVVPLEVDEADAAEQERVLSLDEDDYR
jgi:hypothetical protein